MKRFLILSAALLVSTAPLRAKGGAAPLALDPGKVPAAVIEQLKASRGSASRGLKGSRPFFPSKGGPTCNELDPDLIDCNSSTTSTLLATDCLVQDDDTVFDFYLFEGRQGDEVVINLTSNDFDTFVALFDPAGVLFAFDDDGGAGTNSRIRATLSADGFWGIAANNFFEVSGDPGTYTLSLDCFSLECSTTSTSLCLNQDRFLVEVDWTDFDGNTGPGRTVALGTTADDSGLFYFFGANNWELLIKVLDGCDINDRFWVFAAATTNVGYTIRVTDTQADMVRTFSNPLGFTPPALTSTDAFATCP